MRLSSELILVALAATASTAVSAHAGQHGGHERMAKPVTELGSSAAVDKGGKLWVAFKESTPTGQFVMVQASSDLGKTWSPPQRVQAMPEAIAAEGESRPKIAFGAKGEMYITYTKPLSKPYTGEIRFVRSPDGGSHFLPPVTVHANRDVITHRFDSLIVDREGRIFVAWIDKRDLELAAARKQKYAGAALYYAVSSDGGASFKGDYKVADHSCECCRIGLALDAGGKPVAMWRHVFAPNIRDHAITELNSNGIAGAVQRVTFDDWKIDACPHHGPSLAYAADGTRHQVWFSGKEEGGGALYARAAAGHTLDKPVSLGTAQASHPDVAVLGKQVVVVWKQFEGTGTAIRARTSDDNGVSWHERELARTAADSDQPHLVTSPTAILLVWRTQNEGIRVVPIGRPGS